MQTKSDVQLRQQNKESQPHETAWFPAAVNQHSLMHHFGWMMVGQEVFSHWVTVPHPISMVSGVLPFFLLNLG